MCVQILKPMMLRRLKEDVEKNLAPKEETIIEVTAPCFNISLLLLCKTLIYNPHLKQIFPKPPFLPCHQW
jgi:hypothetical protein